MVSGKGIDENDNLIDNAFEVDIWKTLQQIINVICNYKDET